MAMETSERASEFLKNLPSRNSTNFSQYNHTSFKPCDTKTYIKLKNKDENDLAQKILTDETSLLTRELLKLDKNQSTKKSVKRSNNNGNSNRSQKHRRRDSDSEDNHSINSDDD